MPEAYFIVHVHANGAREVIKVEGAEWTVSTDLAWDPWSRPFAYAYPTTRRVTLSGRIGEGIFYDPNQAPDFTVDDQPAIEAPRLEIEAEDG